MVHDTGGAHPVPLSEKLVFFHKGQWVTTTLAIAQGLAVEHSAVIRCVHAHRAELEKFGHIIFETPPDDLQGSPGPYALLNRHQAVALLLVCPTEPEPMRAFTVRLLKVFLEMHERFGTDPGRGDACPVGLVAVLDLVERVLRRFFPEQHERLLVMAWIMNTVADHLDTRPAPPDDETSAEPQGAKPRRLH